MTIENVKVFVFDSKSRKSCFVSSLPEEKTVSPWPIDNDACLYGMSPCSEGHIVVLHRNDFFVVSDGKVARNNENVGAKAWEIVETATVVIGYTGADGGLSTMQLRREAELCQMRNACQWHAINKRVESNDIIIDELKQLLLWAICQNESDHGEDLPHVIRHARATESVIALSILCQGFLANCALASRQRLGVDVERCIEIGTALYQMGWVTDEAATEESQTVKNLGFSCSEDNPKSELSRTLSIQYWTIPFEGVDSLTSQIEMECKVLRKEVSGRQIGLPDQCDELKWATDSDFPQNVGLLMKAVQAGNEEAQKETFACTVAKAYLELCKLLEAV